MLLKRVRVGFFLLLSAMEGLPRDLFKLWSVQGTELL